jgi:F-type H+-transporting ATPase subunit alpha
MIRAHSDKLGGRVFSFFAGVARIQGLPHVFLHELLLDLADRPVGMVIGFDENFVEALFFSEKYDLAEPVFRSGRSVSVAVSDSLVGRTIDGLGRSRDGLGAVRGELKEVFQLAPPIIDREPVSSPLSTGIKIIDVSLPLGRGQRELIIGDLKLGKSTLAIDAVLNQKNAEPPMYCIYVLCGQKEQKLRELAALFSTHNAFLYSIIVAATADDSFAEQYLAPFVGCAIGEYFRDTGRDALVVYDDLSAHAKTYRSISLLLERAPGREAYPGDIFSLHAGLLERAAKLSKEKGGGSLSALPLIETVEGDITSFIPTNLISITDGQVYLEQKLFQAGFLPAIDIGLSVSRIGSQAQPKVLSETVGGIRLALAQHKELQKLDQLESVISTESAAKIGRGELILEVLKQRPHTNISSSEQVILFFGVEDGLFDDLEKKAWPNFESLLLVWLRNRHDDLLEKIKKGAFDMSTKQEVRDRIDDFKKEFLSAKPNL